MSHTSSSSPEWDVFISHASEDKDLFVRPLAKELVRSGIRVWLDETALRLGDSLRRSIEHGLRHARFGVVVISPAFLSKEWPQRELDALMCSEINGRQKVLPVWHEVDLDFVQSRAPLLADRVATSSSKGLPAVVADIINAITDNTADIPRPESKGPHGRPPLAHEKLLLDFMRGKPDLRWTEEVMVALISDSPVSGRMRTSDIEATIASLIQSGYLLKDKSGTLSVTERALSYYRNSRRR